MVMFEAEANVAWAAGETVITLDAVEVLPHASVNDHDSVYEPPHSLCDPEIIPVEVPLMAHEPDSPLLYASEVPLGGAALQEIVMPDVAANVACAAGETVITLDAVEVLPHASVNDHDSVYEPPHSLCDPEIIPVEVPLIAHEPDSPLLYASEVPLGGAALQEIVMPDVAANVAWAAGETVITLDAVEVLPHASVNDHDSVYEPPHSLCDPEIIPVEVPLMAHEPVSPLLYASEVPVGGAALHEIVMSEAEANVACAAGETVMMRDAVEVLPHASVNDHDSVYEPPHSLCDPEIIPVEVPLMAHEPVSPLL
jgi:uncharacterized Rossmann fold enzyme